MTKSKAQSTAQAIKRARLRLNETQAKFAERLGIDQGTVSRWEDGRAPQSGPTYLWLQRVLADIQAVHPA